MAEYYVRSTGGSDGNTGLTFAQGWATLAYAFSSSTTGDTLYVCSNKNNPFELTSTLSLSSARKYIGCDLTNGIVLNGNGQAEILATATVSGYLADESSTNNVLWQDIAFNANSNAIAAFKINISGTIGAVDYLFRGCEFYNSDGTGDCGVLITTDITPTSKINNTINFHSCKMYDNYEGIEIVDSTGKLTIPVTINNCSIYNNYEGIRAGVDSNVIIVNSRIFNSTADGVVVDWTP